MNTFQMIQNIHHTESTVFEGEHVITQETETRQLGSKQDHVASGTYENNGNPVFWIAAFDGHGNSTVIQTIRSLTPERMNEIMSDKSPPLVLQKEIETKSQHLRDTQQVHSGSTMVYAKVYAEVPVGKSKKHIKIEIGNVGDSQACLILNGQPIFVSEMHHPGNGKEMLRLFQESRLDTTHPIVEQGPSFSILTRDTISAGKGTYLNFVYKGGPFISETCPLSPSQSLGHKGITGISPEVSTFLVKSTDTFQIVLVSDGITDVMPFQGHTSDENNQFCGRSSAQEIVDEAERRWKQKWTVVSEGDHRNAWRMAFPENGYDDCCCAVLKYTEKEKNELVEISLDDPAPYSTADLDDGFGEGEIAKEEYRAYYCS
jgi:serine/threonine protein phosphatase PrpC